MSLENIFFNNEQRTTNNEQRTTNNEQRTTMNNRVFLFFFFLVSFCFSQDILEDKKYNQTSTINHQRITNNEQRATNFLVTFSFSQDIIEDNKHTQRTTNNEQRITKIDVSGFYGSVLRHNTDISHLIVEHPAGLILGYNRKTFGFNEWEQWYNYPDTGVSFVYQNMNNSVLGEHYGLYGHFNFYFLKRNMQFRIGQGITYATNPYDKNKNFRNNAYGSQFLTSTLLMLNYHKENIYKGLGFKAGFTVIHYSNASVKAPNTSTNTLAFNAGLVYSLETQKTAYITREKVKITAPFYYNIAFRTGINESDVIGLGQFPFYIFSGYVDKRIGRKSAMQLGTDVFFSNFLKGLIQFQSVSFPEKNIAADTDFKRVGVFVGHELFINKLSVTTQLGYYVYYPFDFEGKLYNRLGLKRYFGTKWFGEISLKSHIAVAEAVEFGVGIRL